MSDARAILASLRCVGRGLPRLFRRTPGTPLRVLAIMALDTVHLMRRGRCIPPERVDRLAVVLDVLACANAAWDRKQPCGPRYNALRQRLDQAGLTTSIRQHLNLLGVLESGRPSVGGDGRHFNEVRTYREAVARLSLGTVASIAFDDASAIGESRAVHTDVDVRMLFHIVMQCQIIDDVLDYSVDSAASLPSFLTACASLREALALTHQTAWSYGAGPVDFRNRSALPFRLALHAVTVLAVITAGVATGVHAIRRTPRRPYAVSRTPSTFV